MSDSSGEVRTRDVEDSRRQRIDADRGISPPEPLRIGKGLRTDQLFGAGNQETYHPTWPLVDG